MSSYKSQSCNLKNTEALLFDFEIDSAVESHMMLQPLELFSQMAGPRHYSIARDVELLVH